MPQQQKGTRRSPILLTTLVFGMRDLLYDASLSENMSDPETGISWTGFPARSFT